MNVSPHTINIKHYTWVDGLCKEASNHHASLPLEMYSFTL